MDLSKIVHGLERPQKAEGPRGQGQPSPRMTPLEPPCIVLTKHLSPPASPIGHYAKLRDQNFEKISRLAERGRPAFCNHCVTCHDQRQYVVSSELLPLPQKVLVRESPHYLPSKDSGAQFRYPTPPQASTSPQGEIPSLETALKKAPHQSLEEPAAKQQRLESERRQHFTSQALSEHILVLDGSAVENNRITIGRRFACQSCGRSFFRKSDLVRHIQIHLGIKTNVCHVCGKRFVQRSALTVHLRVHTGEKPYSCQICHRAFSDSSSLARHRRIHARHSVRKNETALMPAKGRDACTVAPHLTRKSLT